MMLEMPSSTTNGARRSTPSVEWFRSPARPALQVASALDRVRRAPTILPAMRAVPGLLAVTDETLAAGTPAEAVLEPVLEAIDDPVDSLTAMAAVHALARVPGATADDELAELALNGAPGLEEHALWALGERPFSLLLLRPVARAVARGGLAGTHAQRALARWAVTDAHAVLVALEMMLLEHYSSIARRYLTETIGLVPGRPAAQALERIALDDAEATAVRSTAIAAFADRPDERLPLSISRLRRRQDELAAAVRSTSALRALSRRGPRRDDRADGLHLAHIHLGQVGGLATLLPQLGAALAAGSRVARVTTIVRDAGTTAGAGRRKGHRIERVALADGEGVSFASGWPSLVAATRAIRSALLAGPLPDVLHLRMADPSSLAGATVARELSIPTVFTLAPDPHRPIRTAEAAGTLDRRTFALADARDALWFRADLVERLAESARELVLFPHAGHIEALEELTDVTLLDGPPRHTVIAEGVDTERTDAAAAFVARPEKTAPVLTELQTAIARLPRERHGLPLVVSAGRLHPIKGMSRLVEAFAADELSERANLVIVGGNLRSPAAVEAAELARIRATLDEHPGLSHRVVLLGQRTTEEVALVLAAARAGWGALVAPAGAYACASLKEEFGLAIVESMASGLPVVAPDAGGPATYVRPGVDGVLTDTSDPAAIAAAACHALDLSSEPQTPLRTRAKVDARYTLSRMARDLTAVYRITTAARTLGHEVVPAKEAAA